MSSVAIVGGGISGLSTAYYLSKNGIPCTLIEARPRPGGVIQTERIEDCVIEAGPDSFLSMKPWALDLIRDLGLAGEVIGSNDHQRRTYIRRRGRMVELPDGVQFMVPTRILPMVTTQLVSWPTKFRMAMEWFRRPGGEPDHDRSVSEFVEEHYGREVVEYLAEPLLSGIYGGDPDALSITSVLPRFVELEKKYGSLTRGVLAARSSTSSRLPLFQTLRGGLGNLVEKLGSVIHPTTIQGRAEALERSGPGFRLRVNGDWIAADHVVLACEAHQAARVAAPVDTRISELLATIPYSSSMIVILGFDRASVSKHARGFGFLVPKRERKRVLAGTWIGNKFPHRVPESLTVLRCFLGGVDREAALGERDEAAVDSVRDELREILGLDAAPRFWKVFRWPQSMAQYTVGHGTRIAELETLLAAMPGLYLAGNAYHGIGIPDCVRMGKEAAEKITLNIAAR
jgi:oxygen-dependent protoporphyrinogen oxidase